MSFSSEPRKLKVELTMPRNMKQVSELRNLDRN